MRVLAAMSGGVDSAVAAALLLEAGHEVVGLTLRLFGSDDGADVAASVAAKLGIQHQILDRRDEFEREVLKPSWEVYAGGRTPSPCVRCNPRLKFASLLALADELGADRVASGHHARVGDGPTLLRGRDENKDQSYFLARLSPEQLGKVLFPVGEMTKGEVRDRARALGLPNAERDESQDACFVRPGEGFAEALRLRFSAEARPGDIRDTSGKHLGTHAGIHQFTVGQRRGLQVALGQRAWVVSIDAESAQVTVTLEEDELLSVGLVASDVVWGQSYQDVSGDVEVQVRSRHRPVPARAEQLPGGRMQVRFGEPQRAVTPGQAAVLYHGLAVVGCGWIEMATRG